MAKNDSTMARGARSGWATIGQVAATVLCAALVCSLGACSDDSGSAADAGTDSAIPADVARDTLGDRGAGEGAVVDRGAADVGAAEGGAADLGARDLGADLGPAAGCASGFGTVVSADIAACPAASAVDQCAAAALCASGWALCTASQYQTRYGAATTPPAAVTDVLWLAGCVRDGASPTAPVDGVCSSCGAAKGATVTVGWSCVNSVTTTTDSLHVGLRTSSACTSAGTNSATTQGFWFAWPAKNALMGGLCCRE